MEVYVSGHPGLNRSTDGAVSFDRVNDGLPSTDVHAFGGTDGVLYGSSPAVGVFAGEVGDWEVRSTAAGQSFFGRIIVDPDDDTHLFAGDASAGVAESRDGGQTWQLLDSGLAAATWMSRGGDGLAGAGQPGRRPHLVRTLTRSPLATAPTASTRAVAQRPPTPRLWWNDIDRHRILTACSAAGLLVAGALAVFGLPPVDLHSPLHRIGSMDPACGMTRGVRLTVRGDVGGAMRYNPAAPLAPLGGVLLLVRHAVGWRTGRWADLRVRRTPTLVAITVMAVAALWIRQQANVDLLTNG